MREAEEGEDKFELSPHPEDAIPQVDVGLQLEAGSAKLAEAGSKERKQTMSRALAGGVVAALICWQTASARVVSAWDGTWELDPKLSKLTPSELVIDRRGAEYTLPGTAPHSVVCDGKPRSGPEGFHLSCSQLGRITTTVLLEHGRRFSTTRYELAQDGDRLSTTTEYAHGRRPSTLEIDDYQRVAGDRASLAGRWRGVSTRFAGPVTYVLRLQGEKLYYLDTVEGAVSNAALDGRPTPFWDAHPDGVRWSNRWDGERRIAGEYLLNGTPCLREVLELSSDGKTLRNWIVGAEQVVYVFRKHAQGA